MAFFVYVLFSESHDRHYIGQTDDLKARLERHNKGYESSTKPYVPWKMVWNCEKPDRGAAMILETKLKNLNTQRLLDFMKKYGNDSGGRDEWLGPFCHGADRSVGIRIPNSPPPQNPPIVRVLHLLYLKILPFFSYSGKIIPHFDSNFGNTVPFYIVFADLYF